MKHARRLRRQFDDWQQMWRQVDAFVDRLETARDEDATARRKTDALLHAAGAIERVRRAAGLTPVPLGDPVVDRMPTSGWNPDTDSPVSLTAAQAWEPANRQGRLPGNDDVEMAVADLATASFPPPFSESLSTSLVLDAVRFLLARDTLEVEVDGVLDTLRVPSYPGASHALVSATQVDLAVDSLFSAANRHDATMDSLDPDEDAEPFVKSWSWLAARRRAQRPALSPPPPLTSLSTSAGAPLSSALLDQAAACVADARAGHAHRLHPGTHAGIARALAAAAAAAAAASAADAQALRSAADVLEEEGIDSTADRLAEDLEAAADAVAGSPEALSALARSAEVLAGALAATPPAWPFPSGAAAAVLDAPARAVGDALAALPSTSSLPTLLALPVEVGGVAVELNAVLADRIAYPDGSLRILRTLEISFARWWPVALRWMAARARPGRSLDRAMRRFLDPFIRSLAALVQGTDTGFAVAGLTLGEPGNINAALVVAEAPASLAATLARVVEAGQVAVLAGDRPAAAVVLGVGRQNDRLALPVAPLRVSLVPPDLAPGSPGFVSAGVALTDRGSAISAAELRRGFADDPARDGVVEQAVALHSQLALVVGRSVLAARLAGVSVPEPFGPAIGSVSWHGAVPAMTAAFVLHGVPPEWWDRTGDSPLPVLVRPGELLLLRGEVPPDPEGASPGTAQTVVEVDRAVWLPGSMIDRVDTSRAALLATDPAVLGDLGGPTLLCTPRDDLVLLTLRRTWQVGPLHGPLSFRRDFAGFDLASLATGVPLGDTLVGAVTGTSPEPGLAGVDRALELGAATGVLDDWTRHAR